MPHNTPAVAFGPEVDLTPYGPVLAAELEDIASLLPRIPRQATYQTYVLVPGQLTAVLGFDASRQRAAITVNSTTPNIAVAGIDVSTLDVWGGTDAPVGTVGGIVLTPAYPTELRNQAPLYIIAPGTNTDAVTVSVLVESHAIV